MERPYVYIKIGHKHTKMGKKLKGWIIYLYFGFFYVQGAIHYDSYQ